MTEVEPIPDWQIWLLDIAGPVSTTYFWALYLIGFALCVWTFIRVREKGYLIVAIFFLSPLFVFLSSQVSYQIHKKQIEEMRSEMTDSPEISPPTRHTRTSVKLPVFETFLVVGLYFLSKKQRKSEPCVPANPSQH